MSAAAATPALACVPAAIPAAERRAHFDLARELFTKLAQERIPLPNGHAFISIRCIRGGRTIRDERAQVLPLFTFELQLAAQSGPLWLRMTGPEGTREVLEAELNLARSCALC